MSKYVRSMYVVCMYVVCMVWYGMLWYGMYVCMYACMYFFLKWCSSCHLAGLLELVSQSRSASQVLQEVYHVGRIFLMLVL